MPIKNYSTTQSSNVTVGKIQVSLAKGGAQSLSVDYKDGEPDAVRFSVSVNGHELWFRLPCNPEGFQKTMQRDRVRPSRSTLTQARAASWRVIQDWIEAQIAIIDAGQVKLSEVFFPYLLQPSGETLYQKFENQQLQLGTGE